MDSLTKIFQQFAADYKVQKQGAYGGNSSLELIKYTAPSVVQDLLPRFGTYKVYGSAGTGNWAEIPWVAILDKDITKSTQNGYYVVYLFDHDLETVTISLALGYTQFEKEFGVKDARAQIQAVAHHYSGMLSGDIDNFSSGKIPLNAENNLGKGYELGSVMWRQYHIDQLDDQELVLDLDTLMSCYTELKQVVGDSILNIEVDADADLHDETVKSFQKHITARTNEETNEAVIDALIKETQVYPRQIREKLVKQIARNRKIATLIKKKRNYVCELCGREPFVQKNGQPYAEADHIIPIGGETKGEDSIDNLRCLCAQCHAVVTHGSHTEIAKLLSIRL